MSLTLAGFLLLQFAFATSLHVRLSAAGTHAPVAGARVRLEKLGVPVGEIVMFDSKAEFLSLAPGRYTVVVDAPGYQKYHAELDLPWDSFSFIELRPDNEPRNNTPHLDNPSGQSIRRFLHKLFG
jgi:hypothetical protein